MFNSATCGRQFRRYDLEYIRLLPAVKKVAGSQGFPAEIFSSKKFLWVPVSFMFSLLYEIE